MMYLTNYLKTETWSDNAKKKLPASLSGLLNNDCFWSLNFKIKERKNS